MKEKRKTKGASRSQRIRAPKWDKMEEGKRFHVVGIGASAGGLEALKQLFEHLPGDTGMGFVIVQHLDPKHPSLLTELISRVTRMPVVEVTDGMKVSRNSVYVIPPNTRMAMMHDTLCLLPRSNDGDHPMPIDYFFDSLASDLKNRAIGVILSGTASDGTHGLQAIKAVGGMTFAQDQKTAMYFGMPGSAIDSGAVDLVFPPMEIAEELARIGRRPMPMIQEDEHETDSIAADARSVAKIHFLLRTHSGVDFSHYKPSTINRRIARRMFLHRLENLADYVKYLTAHPAEVEGLYQDLLIIVTGFFRDPEVFDLLKKVIFPKILADKSVREPIRIWVPGCATGEEAYSIAIALIEVLRTKPTERSIQIFATDLSEVGIRKARAGLYSSSIISDVSSDRLRRFFVKTEGGYQVNKMIRDMCVYATHDLVKDPPFSRMDLISCRNVLIYLGPVLQKRIIPMFHYALNEGGYLMLGTSETIGAHGGLFAVVDRKYKVYMKKGGVSGRSDHRLRMSLSEMNSVAASLDSRSTENAPVHDVQAEMERIILARFSPPGVLVNSAFEIIRYQGQTGAFLQAAPGAPSLNILRMAREGLLLELRTGLQEAKKRDQLVQRKNVPFQSEDGTRFVSLEIVPIKTSSGNSDRHFLVLFKPLEADADKSAGKPSAEKESSKKARPKDVEHLRNELRATRDYLQATIEEQETTNEELHLALEEIRSSNEELQSTNEEMETAKEELQSTNEELVTVNEEQRSTNAELNVVNNDLLNLLNNISFAVIMVDNDLRIRRFTPAAGKALNLLPADVGRPITDLRLDIEVPNLGSVVEKVVTTMAPEEMEIRTREGRTYMLRISPYRTLENQIEGVMLTMLDVDKEQRPPGPPLKTLEVLQDFQNSLDVPVIMMDEDFTLVHVNPAFAGMFETTAAQITGRPLFTALGGKWNTGELREQLEMVKSREGEFGTVVAEVDLPGRGLRRVIFRGHKIRREGDGGWLLVLTMVETP